MKKTLLMFGLIMATSFFTTLKAQISVGRDKVGSLEKFKKGEYDIIKSKTSIFVNDDFTIDEMETILKQVWTINPYKVISREEFEKNASKYVTESNAIWKMNALLKTKTSQKGFTSEYLYVYYEYFYPTDIKEKKKKLDYDTNEIAAIFMGGNTDAMWEMVRKVKFGDLQEDLYNYQLGYVKNYLQYVNDLLVNQGTSWAYDTDYDKAKVKELATKTIYVPEYLKTKSIWGYKDKDRLNPDELFEKYPYKYEWISDEVLNKKILSGGSEDFYYVFYTKVNSQKMVTVTNGKNGDVIYKDYQTMSYQLKPKDLGELADAVKKSLKK